jgi:D-serine deaminase-like pyridoxal phosphate-dependent protein
MRHMSWESFRRAIADQPLPCALVDLDAFEANTDRLFDVAAAHGKKVRIATKSIRAPELVRRIEARRGRDVCGLMTYTAAETRFLADQGWKDLLLAYPTLAPRDAELLAGCPDTTSVVVDDPAQLDVLAAAHARVGVVIEIDMAYRPTDSIHLGVRRSPLRAIDAVLELARAAVARGLSFRGIMGYEAQIAGLTDHNRAPLMDAAKRALKRLSRRDVERTRAEVVAALRAHGLAPAIVNGGGTGSLSWSSAEVALTEVTAGSGFLCGHLFDHYKDLHVEPAAYYALQVVRRPAPNMVTCHGGGYTASGEIGLDRAPVPSLPPGLRLLPHEGAGEVQTPVLLPRGIELRLGDPVFFRHAKSGELAEHFAGYALVRGDRLEGHAPTYRGLGHCFL